MANYNMKLDNTAVRLGEVRFSFVNVFEPKSTPNGDLKYSCSILIPKSDTTAVKLVQDAIAAAQEVGKGSKWGGKIPKPCKSPLRDGDLERDDPIYEGHWFINASATTKNRPQVSVLEGRIMSDALDSDDFYSGCYGIAFLNFYPYDASGNRGVGAGLNGVVKTRDGEKLSGGVNIASAMADLIG